MVDFSGSMNYRNSNKSILRPNLGFSYMKMVSNRWMLGGGIQYSPGTSTDFNSASRESYPYSIYTISPRFRYYFSNKKIAPFTFLDSEFFTKKYKDTSFEKTSWGLETFAGIGVNYFIAKNVAIESTLKTNVINLGNNKDNPLQVNWNTSLKLFLNTSFTNTVDSLSSKVLKKGNFTTSAKFSFNHIRNEDLVSRLSITPNIRFFITDRLNIYASLYFNKTKHDYSSQVVTHSYSGGYSLGAEHYQKILGNFFSSVGLGFSRSEYGTTIQSEILNTRQTNHQRNFVLTTNLTFHYFKKQKRFYGGIRYVFYELNVTTNSTRNDNFRTLTIFGGLDYYVFNNVYVQTNLNLVKTKYENRSDYLGANLSFGIGYLFNANDFRF